MEKCDDLEVVDSLITVFYSIELNQEKAEFAISYGGLVASYQNFLAVSTAT